MTIPKASQAPLAELSSFLAPFSKLLLRSESRHALERYTTGLLADLPRKTAAEMGRALPGTNHQRLQELLTRTQWDSTAMDRLRIGHMMEHARSGKGVLIFDDTGLPKKGKHSVGVARQYSGTLGRVDTCQILVTSHYVDQVFDWPVKAGLYLPESWIKDEARCQRAGVPRGFAFMTKGEIALALYDQSREAGLKVAAVVADAGYGDQPVLLDGLESRKQPYAIAVHKTLRFRTVERVEADPGDSVPPEYKGFGRPCKAPSLADRVPNRWATITGI